MKKITKSILIVILVAISLVTLVGCAKHEHSYGEWHTVTNADCIHTGLKERVCECGEKETEELPITNVHSFSSYQTVVSAGCTSNGFKERTCKVCGKKESVTINATGHNYSSPTCTESSHCTKCGQTSGTALGHNFSSGKCTRCGVTTFTLLKEYVITNGKYIDNLYVLNIYSVSKSNTSTNINITYDKSENVIYLSDYAVSSSSSSSLTVLTNITISPTFTSQVTWDTLSTGSSKYYISGELTPKTYTNNTTLTYSYTTATSSSIKSSLLDLARSQINLILTAYKTKMDSSGITLESLGFVAYYKSLS